MKPQIEAWRLDGEGASPHLDRMVERDEDRTGSRDTREDKLAQALRANLRRRKAAGAAAPKPKPREGSSD